MTSLDRQLKLFDTLKRFGFKSHGCYLEKEIKDNLFIQVIHSDKGWIVECRDQYGRERYQSESAFLYARRVIQFNKDKTK